MTESLDDQLHQFTHGLQHCETASPEVVKLREYQERVIAEIDALIAKGVKRILLVAPTSSGKTTIAAAFIRRVIHDRRKSVVFAAHSDELLVQARDELREHGVVAGIIKAGRDGDRRPLSQVQVCGVQTIHARHFRTKRMELPPCDVLFIDECHRARAATYQQVINAYPGAIVIGLTATPVRGDGHGLGTIFEAMVQCPQPPQLIEQGFLVGARIFAPPPPDLRGIAISAGDYQIDQLEKRMDTDKLVGDIVEHWLKHAERRRTVVYATGRLHAGHIYREMVNADIRAEYLDGETPKDDRIAMLERLRSGETEVIVNCKVLTEGYNLPVLGSVVIARPTRSLGLFLQMCGRGGRIAPGKTDYILLDHAGAVHRHGRPDDEFEWTLAADERAANKTHAARIAKTGSTDPFCECTACGHLRVKGEACTNCGWKPKPRARDVSFIPGDLVELGKPNHGPSEADKQQFYLELCGYGLTARKKDGTPYHPKWAANQFRTKHGHYPPWAWNDLPPLQPSDVTRRWIKSRIIAWAKSQGKAAT